MESLSKVDEPFPTPPPYFLPGKMPTQPAWFTCFHGSEKLKSVYLFFQMKGKQDKMWRSTIFTHLSALRQHRLLFPFLLQLAAPPKLTHLYQVLTHVMPASILNTFPFVLSFLDSGQGCCFKLEGVDCRVVCLLIVFYCLKQSKYVNHEC